MLGRLPASTSSTAACCSAVGNACSWPSWTDRASRDISVLVIGGGWPMKVKMILPALTEATSPFFRPIKYSLFPPLGLATLAAYLGDDERSRFRTSTSRCSIWTTRPISW